MGTSHPYSDSSIMYHRSITRTHTLAHAHASLTLLAENSIRKTELSCPLDLIPAAVGRKGFVPAVGLRSEGAAVGAEPRLPRLKQAIVDAPEELSHGPRERLHEGAGDGAEEVADGTEELCVRQTQHQGQHQQHLSRPEQLHDDFTRQGHLGD